MQSTLYYRVLSRAAMRADQNLYSRLPFRRPDQGSRIFRDSTLASTASYHLIRPRNMLVSNWAFFEPRQESHMASGAVYRQLAQIPSLTMRRASAFRASKTTRGICFLLSNRELHLLESVLSHRKHVTEPRSNRELSTIAKNSSGCTKLEIIRIRKTGDLLRG